MISQEEISQNQQMLYESASLRDDLDDGEASILLQWGEGQVVRIAQDFPEDFEKKARFLRQLIKNINRFVGQREFNDLDGQKGYMSKVTMYLPELGWGHITEEMLFAVLPEDKKDMFGTLRAILNTLTPPARETETSGEITNPYKSTLENANTDSITQVDSDSSEEGSNHGEEEVE